MTTSQIADALGVSRQTVSRWIREGRLAATAIAVGPRPIYRVREVDSLAFVRRYVQEFFQDADRLHRSDERESHALGPAEQPFRPSSGGSIPRPSGAESPTPLRDPPSSAGTGGHLLAALPVGVLHDGFGRAPSRTRAHMPTGSFAAALLTRSGRPGNATGAPFAGTDRGHADSGKGRPRWAAQRATSAGHAGHGSGPGAAAASSSTSALRHVRRGQDRQAPGPWRHPPAVREGPAGSLCRSPPGDGPHDVVAGRLLLHDALPGLPRVSLVLADRGYKALDKAAQRHNARFEVRSRPAGTVGFKPLALVWRVETTFAQLGRWRRLSRCFEGSAESARAWLEVACFGYMLGRV
jgi:excisionase family DNA binding protein